MKKREKRFEAPFIRELDAYDLDHNNCEDWCYSLTDVSKIAELVELKKEDLWVGFKSNEFGWIDFCFFEYYCQYSQGPEVIWARPMWCGSGPGGKKDGEGDEYSLRELRHSYFGPTEDGYLFYVNRDNLVLASNWLDKYFDRR